MIRLDARLSCALEMLQGSQAVADIGCDHGKLTAALLQKNICQQVIAGDISPLCLEKTSRLIQKLNLVDRAEVRLGSGLEIIAPGECDACALLGMGGELMIELLSACPQVVAGFHRLVLQPMTGVEELRRWLYENRFHLLEDKIAAVGDRLYQVLCLCPSDTMDPWPKGFPEGYFGIGYRAFEKRDPLLLGFTKELLQRRQTALALAKGTPKEAALVREIEPLTAIIKEASTWN